jgi:1-acyl-sn-glycerol-3-phosphate acyltransferase
LSGLIASGFAEFSMWAWLMTLAAAAALLVSWRRSGLELPDFLAIAFFRAYGRLWHGCVLSQWAPLPDRGPVLLVANHSSSVDPCFLACATWRPISFVIAREYVRLPVVGRFFVRHGYVPVQRNGHDVCGIRQCLRRLSEGRILCIFPEGGLSNAGRTQPARGKPGVALLALRSRAPVVPVRIAGGPQTADLAQAWMRPSRARITFGPVVDLSPYYNRPIKRKLLEEVTDLLMKRVDELRPPVPNHRGGRHACCNRQ